MNSSRVDATTEPRIDGIDLLRGLSILFVLMNHVNMRLLFAKVPYTKGLPAQLVSSLVWNGQYGVQIFFVVSGFLITSTSIRRWQSLRALRIKEFYLLRFARIAPLMFLLLGILSCLHISHAARYVISPKTGGAAKGSSCRTNIPYQCSRSEEWLSSRKLGYPLVTLPGGDVLSFLSSRRSTCPGKKVSRSSDHALRDCRTVRPSPGLQPQSGLA